MAHKVKKGIRLSGGVIGIGVSSVFFLFSVFGTSFAEGGKELFIQNKCNKCHSIKAEGIEPLESSLKEKGKELKDLSGVGLEADAEWIKKFLKKEVANKEGKKHKEKWKGSDADLETIANYLANMKTKIDEKEIKAWYEELRSKLK